MTVYKHFELVLPLSLNVFFESLLQTCKLRSAVFFLTSSHWIHTAASAGINKIFTLLKIGLIVNKVLSLVSHFCI